MPVEYKPPPVTPTASQVLLTIAVTVGLAVLAAFWALSDPRVQIANLESNKLSLREHAAFEVRVARDIARLEDENRHQLAVDTFLNWKIEHEHSVEDLQRLAEGKLSKAEAEEVWRQRRAELDDLHKQIDALRSLLAQHERDDRSALTPRGNGNGR